MPGTRLITCMLAARSWLESPTTLNVVTALGTVLAGIGAILVILIAGPRYRLRYGPLTSQQLSDGSWKVHIYLSSRGRRDITRDAFDDGKPLVLDIGTSIRELVDVWSSHEAVRSVDARAEGTCLLVGPGLITRRLDFRFTVLAVARPTPLKCQASLIDVSVRRQFLTPTKRRAAAWCIIPLAVLAMIFVTGAILMSAGIRFQPFVVTAITAILTIGTASWINLRFRYPAD